MKISQALILAQKNLQQNKIETAAIDALLLLQHATKFSKEQVVFNPDFVLTQKQQDDFWQAIERRSKREPVSHILENREFYALDFFVNGNVLDPRPDSESLIELALQVFCDKKQKLQILELGVGSGCLTITLLKQFENAAAIGVDLSQKALEVAQKNSQKHQVEQRFELLQSDLFANISDKKFDLIISNPPYIKKHEIENLADEVKLFEPRMALDGGDDGLQFYRQIAKKGANFLNNQGLILLEVGHDQAQEVAEIFAKENFKLKQIKRDLAGFERAMLFSI